MKNSIFSEISSLTFKIISMLEIAHSLCHVTYVTYFDKCSDADVKLATV